MVKFLLMFNPWPPKESLMWYVGLLPFVSTGILEKSAKENVLMGNNIYEVPYSILKSSITHLKIPG